ncbi:gluconolactonase [Terrabacter tumescens]|uniref:Gluconolactonase n=1 Tax=Terrabacter tumescens TaxID=60443 RepID=A0ABQ2IF27_9MICO|nr:SMP-30/gluconolactonase/LRE family protein [Terrabacter tumescens]GGN07959.1 gluconolactonase [Terrabacter tumescens]
MGSAIPEVPVVTGELEQVTDALCYHGEGPVWSPEWGGLRWVDMLAGDVLTLRADGFVDRMHVGDVAAFVRPRTGGGWVVATERGLARADEADGIPTPWFDLWDDPSVRMNEGGVDGLGRLWAGTMGYDRVPGSARLFRVDPVGCVAVVLPDVTISNGIDLSPDGRLAYYDDTPTGRTDVFDVVDGELVGRRPFVTHDVGHPDGLTVDRAGNVWVALNGAGRVRCFSPAGEVLAEVAVPVRLTTACTFGGDDLRDLYVTTSRENLDDPEPEAGALFRVRVSVPGQPVRPFAG